MKYVIREYGSAVIAFLGTLCVLSTVSNLCFAENGILAWIKIAIERGG